MSFISKIVLSVLLSSVAVAALAVEPEQAVDASEVYWVSNNSDHVINIYNDTNGGGMTVQVTVASIGYPDATSTPAVVQCGDLEPRIVKLYETYRCSTAGNVTIASVDHTPSTGTYTVD